MSTRSIRFRITAVAVAMSAIVLVVGGVVLALLQRSALTASIDQTLVQRADDIASLLQEGSLPEQFAQGSDEGFVQLVNLDGGVAASTPNLEGAPALDLRVVAAETIRNVKGLPVDDDVFRVLTRRLDQQSLHIGITFDTVAESTGALVASLALTIPALVAALGVLVWWLAGRTLRPVEDIRSEVASIGSTDLQRRVPRPGTGDEIDRLSITMNQMLDRLETSVDRQQRFAADASHELRSPLTRLRTQLELEISSEGNGPDPHYLRSLLEEVIGMQEMVDDLLYLARADAHGTPAIGGQVDLDDLVLREGKRIAGNRRVIVDSSHVSGASVCGDRGQLGRAVKNLLDNAERHAASRVDLALREVGGHAILTVADDGPGIPTSGAERVFERFGRLDEARSTSAGGTGLGLAIAREIAERHGGTLTLVNPGQPGATFEMKVPLSS